MTGLKLSVRAHSCLGKPSPPQACLPFHLEVLGALLEHIQGALFQTGILVAPKAQDHGEKPPVAINAINGGVLSF